LPQLPWFALREVYRTSRQQYVERSGSFLVKGYSEWIKCYGFAAVAHPVAAGISDVGRINPTASGGFAGKLRAKVMVFVHRGERHNDRRPLPAERRTAEQAL
jgi:hypothetical protein